MCLNKLVFSSVKKKQKQNLHSVIFSPCDYFKEETAVSSRLLAHASKGSQIHMDKVYLDKQKLTATGSEFLFHIPFPLK